MRKIKKHIGKKLDKDELQSLVSQLEKYFIKRKLKTKPKHFYRVGGTKWVKH